MSPAPPNAADNMPIRRWPSTEPQYENWYSLVNHPTRRFAFWFRYTLLTTSTGVREARVWAIPVDGDDSAKTRTATVQLPQDAFRAGEELTFGDVGRVRHGNMSGSVRDERGAISWDLSFTPNPTTIFPVSSSTVRRFLSKSAHRSPNSAVLMSGHVTVDGERIELTNATGHQGHTDGIRMQTGWTWARAGGFEHDPDAMFEGISIRRGSRLIASFTVRAAGKTFALNRLSNITGILGPRTTTESQPGSFRLEGECERRKVMANVNAATLAPVKVRYLDTDGGHKFNCMYPLASCALSITPAVSGSNVSTTLLAKHRANVEFVSPTPLLGSADEYFPKF